MAKRRQKIRPADDEPVVMLLDRRGPPRPPDGEERSSPASAVYIAVVTDPAKLAAERSLGVHTDVVDALVDLMIELVDNEGTDGSSTPSR